MPGPLVGRDAEVQALSEALERVRSGRGEFTLVVGEAGIGKSRLIAELVERAARANVELVTGYCWESGGAPAFWPWTQILRALLRRQPEIFEHRRARLQPLLPELDAGTAADGTAVDAEQARFLLMDGVASALVELTGRAPLLLVFEDLHAADPSSLALLELVAQQLRGLPLGIVGTAREGHSAASRQGLARLGRLATSLPLSRLRRPEVATLLAHVLGEAPPTALASGVHGSTEGNPLYVIEVARRLRTGGAPGAELPPLPASIRAMITDNLLRLTPATRAVLEAASVLGRELAARPLEQLLGADLAPALAEAAEHGVLEPLAGGRWRFSHGLVRDVLEDGIEPARARQLHATAAAVLRASARTPPWPRLAHHLLNAGDAHRADACDAARRAAEQSLQQLAFDEAARWFDAALEALDAASPEAQRARGNLLVARGRAQLLAGERQAGMRTCREARALARELDDPELFARGCLAAGSVFTVAIVDDELVGCLREALQRLPTGPSALRARVAARLAAGLQPADDPAVPIAMALDAIAMARATGSPTVLLEALRAGMAALQDLAPPQQRLPLNREHLQLAVELGEAAHAFCALTRVVFDAFELGDVASAREAIARAAALADELGHPGFIWSSGGAARARCVTRAPLPGGGRARRPCPRRSRAGARSGRAPHIAGAAHPAPRARGSGLRGERAAPRAPGKPRGDPLRSSAGRGLGGGYRGALGDGAGPDPPRAHRLHAARGRPVAARARGRIRARGEGRRALPGAPPARAAHG